MIDNNETICIVGLGAHTPVGLTAPSSAAAVRAGINRISEHPFMLDKTREAVMVARISHIFHDVIGVERLMKLALPAIQEALTPLGRFVGEISPFPLFIGLPAPRPGLPKNLAVEIENRFKEKNNKSHQFSEVTMIACGHSAGLMAIQEGRQRILNGAIEICLAGGLDSYMEPETLEWLDKQEQLHSPTNKWGFMPGEAAGFCLLASPKVMQRYQLKTLGGILASATAREKNLIKTDTVCTGEGLTNAFKRALQIIKNSTSKVDQVICDMNGERYRADEFGFTIARTLEYFVDSSDFLAPADCWGDVGAASGPLFVNLAVAARARGYVKGPLTLIWTSSESGERCALLLQV